MVFLSPAFLWGLLLLGVPVIIHLFSFRRHKKVFFSNVRLLREIREETKSRSRLKEIVILVMRCLALASLVLAFAQPFLPSATHPAAASVGIYIDNSFSMNNVNRQGPLLDVVKAQAADFVRATDGHLKFYLLTNDFDARHQRLFGREDVIREIQDIRTSPSARLFSEVLGRASEFLGQQERGVHRFLAFTDGQRSTFNLTDCRPDSTIRLAILPQKANRQSNVAIDSCWFATPVQQLGFPQKLNVRIRNFGQDAVQGGNARLVLNGAQAAIASFSVAANGFTDIVLGFTCRQAGPNFGSLKIEDQPVTFDDELFFAFDAQQRIRVYVISGRQASTQPFASLFNSDSLFSVHLASDDAIDYSLLRDADVLVLNSIANTGEGLFAELDKFVDKGGAILLVPSRAALPSQALLSHLHGGMFGKFDSSAVKTESVSAHGFYEGVFNRVDERMNVPQVTGHFVLRVPGAAYQPVLRLQNGDAYLGRTSFENAWIYVLTSPLDDRYGNFARHALFVPTVYKICFSSIRAVPLFYTAGENATIELRSGGDFADAPPRVTALSGKGGFIPGVRRTGGRLTLFTQGEPKAPGHYRLVRGDTVMLPLAFNYSRVESDLAVNAAGEMRDELARKGWKDARVEDVAGSGPGGLADEGVPLWKLFIILALLFLTLEAILLRALK